MKNDAGFFKGEIIELLSELISITAIFFLAFSSFKRTNSTAENDDNVEAKHTWNHLMKRQ